MLRPASRILAACLSSSIVALAGGNAWAKGLDTLTPEVKEADDQQADDGAKTDKTKGTGQAATKMGKTAEVTAQSVEPSAASRAIAGKLFVATSVGYSSITSDGDSWNKGGSADVSVGYLLVDRFLGNSKLFGTVRYAPQDVVPVIKGSSFRGVVEGYHFGTQADFSMSSKLKANASAELGYMVSNIHSIDTFTEQDGLDDNGVNFTLGGGADWVVLDKMTIGPKLRLGFGKFQVIQLACNVGFIF